MRIAICDFGGQSVPLARALQLAEHELSMDGPTDLYLVDLDPDKFAYREAIDFYANMGAVVLLYPHGAGGVNLCYDGVYEPYERVDGELVCAPGNAEFYRRLGIERPVREIGWSYCRQFPFRATEKVRRVTFAPTHPNGDGSMLAENLEANRVAFEALAAGPWELVVRYLGTLEECGLSEDPRVHRFIRGDRDMSTPEIDSADVVVASQGSYLSLAVARGRPAVCYNQETPSNYGLSDEEAVPRARWSLYSDLVRFPIDLGDGPAEEVLARAAASDEDVREWRRNWIGEPLDMETVAGTIEAFAEEIKANRDARSRETAAAAAR